MGFGRMLAYAMIGVGAVAAAPFTGGGSLLAGASLGASLAGAGTIAAAVGAGAIGAGIAVAQEDSEDAKHRREKWELEREGMEKDEEIARLTMENKELCRRFSDYSERMKDTGQYFYFVKACFAFGVAIAKVDDGRIDEDEMRELKEFLYGRAGEKLPEGVKKQMRDMLQEEMPFEKAWPFIEDRNRNALVDKEGREIIRDMLCVVANANGDFHKNQEEFIMKYEAGMKRMV